MSLCSYLDIIRIYWLINIICVSKLEWGRWGGGGGLQLANGLEKLFYLTTHSTHFILRLYGVGHMVKDHSDSERGNPLPPHRLLFPINSKCSFICIIPQTG